MAKSIIEKLEHVAGKVTSYDGNYVIWTVTGVHDVRDVLPKGVTLADATEALAENDAEEHKKRKAAVRAAKDAE
jgi:hypothetical protein